MNYTLTGTFRLEDYSYWLEHHAINLVNYAAAVGTDVLIMSPIKPAPIGVRWFSLNMDDKLPHRNEEDLSLATLSYLERFQKEHTVWNRVFQYDEFSRWLKIVKVNLEYADVFRVFVNMTGDAVVQTFDVLISLMIFGKKL